MGLEEAQGRAGKAESQAQLLHLLTEQRSGVGGGPFSESFERKLALLRGGVSTPSLSTILALSPMLESGALWVDRQGAK